MGTSPDHPVSPNPAGGPVRERPREQTAAAQAARAQKDAVARNVRVPIPTVLQTAPLPPGQHAADQHLEPPEGIADAAVRYGTEHKETTAA
jgi:hypothetical protein